MCKTCNNINGKRSRSRRSKVNGFDQDQAMELVTDTILPIGAGVYLSKMADAEITKALKDNAKYKSYLKLLAGGLIGATQEGFVQNLGVGIAVDAMVEVVTDLMADDPPGPKVTESGPSKRISLLPPAEYVPYSLAGMPRGSRIREGQLR